MPNVVLESNMLNMSHSFAQCAAQCKEKQIRQVGRKENDVGVEAQSVPALQGAQFTVPVRDRAGATDVE